MITNHCSMELLEAIKGIGPFLRWPIRDEYGNDGKRICGATKDSCGTAIAYYPGHESTEDKSEVDCPACLKLMLLAQDPVRRYYLLEKGILNELIENQT